MVLWLLLAVSCSTDVRVQSPAAASEFAVVTSASGLLVPGHLAGYPDTLWLILDSGAGRTVLDRGVAARLNLRPTSKGTITGVGKGTSAVDIVPNVTLELPGVTVAHVALRLASMPGSPQIAEPLIAGIIGYDLLCGSVVTIDYQRRRVAVTAPAAFHAPLEADVLPLAIRRRWSFVHGTIKVPGRPPVDDEFLLDTGSGDFVNHPVIKQSTGALRRTQTGAGGFGEPQAGVIGENEWFRLGRTTIERTQSVCCAASPEVSRQIGAGILEQFRVTFDYPHRRLILEQPRRPKG
jgi:Aspartyl protease